MFRFEWGKGDLPEIDCLAEGGERSGGRRERMFGVVEEGGAVRHCILLLGNG